MILLLFPLTVLASSFLFHRTLAQPPPNDAASGAIDVNNGIPISDGFSTVISGSTVTATDNDPEASACDFAVGSIGSVVWYSFTANAPGVISVNTFSRGTDFDTELRVLDPDDASVCVAADEEDGGYYDYYSQVGFNAESCKEYLIAVGTNAPGASTGTFGLDVFFERATGPPEECFAAPSAVPSAEPSAAPSAEPSAEPSAAPFAAPFAGCSCLAECGVPIITEGACELEAMLECEGGGSLPEGSKVCLSCDGSSTDDVFAIQLEIPNCAEINGNYKALAASVSANCDGNEYSFNVLPASHGSSSGGKMKGRAMGKKKANSRRELRKGKKKASKMSKKASKMSKKVSAPSEVLTCTF